jgi:hypothetical protein
LSISWRGGENARNGDLRHPEMRIEQRLYIPQTWRRLACRVTPRGGKLRYHHEEKWNEEDA